MWSAFWTQSPSIGARFEPEWCGIESDIMECFESGKQPRVTLWAVTVSNFEKKEELGMSLTKPRMAGIISV